MEHRLRLSPRRRRLHGDQGPLPDDRPAQDRSRVNSTEMMEAFEEPVERILEAVHSVLERTPPELVADISNNGIVMTGGGSLVWTASTSWSTARTGIHTRGGGGRHLLRGRGHRQEPGLSGRYAGRNGESVPQKTDELRSIDFAPKSRASALLFL